jgi:hypothetical protein
VSARAFDASKPAKMSLLGNISTSAEKTGTEGTEHMLPLCNRQTLDLLGMSVDQLREVSFFCTSYMRFALDRLQETPERFALPRTRDRQAVLGPLRPIPVVRRGLPTAGNKP